MDVLTVFTSGLVGALTAAMFIWCWKRKDRHEEVNADAQFDDLAKLLSGEKSAQANDEITTQPLSQQPDLLSTPANHAEGIGTVDGLDVVTAESLADVTAELSNAEEDESFDTIRQQVALQIVRCQTAVKQLQDKLKVEVERREEAEKKVEELAKDNLDLEQFKDKANDFEKRWTKAEDRCRRLENELFELHELLNEDKNNLKLVAKLNSVENAKLDKTSTPKNAADVQFDFRSTLKTVSNGEHRLDAESAEGNGSHSSEAVMPNETENNSTPSSPVRNNFNLGSDVLAELVSRAYDEIGEVSASEINLSDVAEANKSNLENAPANNNEPDEVTAAVISEESIADAQKTKEMWEWRIANTPNGVEENSNPVAT